MIAFPELDKRTIESHGYTVIEVKRAIMIFYPQLNWNTYAIHGAMNQLDLLKQAGVPIMGIGGIGRHTRF